MELKLPTIHAGRPLVVTKAVAPLFISSTARIELCPTKITMDEPLDLLRGRQHCEVPLSRAGRVGCRAAQQQRRNEIDGTSLAVELGDPQAAHHQRVLLHRAKSWYAVLRDGPSLRTVESTCVAFETCQ